MNIKQVITKLEEKKVRLEDILNATYSRSGDEHERKILNAKNYIKEVKYLISSLQFIKKDIFLVSESTLDDKVKKADFSSIEEEGEFFKLGFIQNFPYHDIYLLYLAPLSNL